MGRHKKTPLPENLQRLFGVTIANQGYGCEYFIVINAINDAKAKEIAERAAKELFKYIQEDYMWYQSIGVDVFDVQYDIKDITDSIQTKSYVKIGVGDIH